MQPIFNLNNLDCLPVFCVNQPEFDVNAVKALPLAYVLDGKGWLLWRKSELVSGFTRLKAVEGLTPLAEGCHYLPTKIPQSLWNQIVEFFKAIYRRQKSEAAGILVYNPAERFWNFVVPEQTVGGASARYSGNRESFQGCLDEGFQLAGTVHSHGSMSAFHSGTDKDDEANFDGLHVTVGHCERDEVEYAISVVLQEKRYKFDHISDVVDIPQESVTVPQNWLDAVKEPPSAKPTDPELLDAMAWQAGQMSMVEYLDASRKKPAKKSVYKPNRSFFNQRRFSDG